MRSFVHASLRRLLSHTHSRLQLLLTAPNATLAEPLESRLVLSGTFERLPNLSVSDVMADFDNDGDVDGVNLRDALQAAAVQVQVRRQTSPGAWSAEPAYTLTFPQPIGAITRFYALDLDGDSDIDITFAGKMLINDGTGNFAVGSPVSMPANLGTLVNLDGDSDLESVALSPTDNIVRVYDLTAPATFTIVSQWSVAPESMMQVGRIDGDGRPDVVTWTRSATGTVDVRSQQQDGTFVPANVPPGQYFDFADFTGDGLLDGISFDRRTMRFGTADGQFSMSRAVKVPEYMRSADFDGDGRSDLLFIRNPISQFLGGSANVYFALSDPGTFSLSQSAPVPFVTISHTGFISMLWKDVRDINLDGRADLDYSSPLRALQIGLSWYTLVDNAVQLNVATPPQARLFDGDVSTFVLLATGYAESPSCELYIDSNDNGLPDQEDLFYANSVPGTGIETNLRLHSFPIGNSLGYGTGKILVVNRSQGIAYTSFTVEHWSRQFSAEGFKSSTVNEHIALVNYRDFGVPYEIVVHYEDGTNEIVNRGTLDPHRRDGFSTSLRGNPNASIVRPNIGYAIEVRSRVPIGASLSRYDTFGRTDFEGAGGESFSGELGTRFIESGLSTIDRLDYILFFQPTPSVITMQFMLESGQVIYHTHHPAGLPRSGILLRDIPALANQRNIVVNMFVFGPMSVWVSSYDFAPGSRGASLTRVAPWSAESPVIAVPLATQIPPVPGLVDEVLSGQIIIANPSDLPRTFRVSVSSSTGQTTEQAGSDKLVVVPARSSRTVAPGAVPDAIYQSGVTMIVRDQNGSTASFPFAVRATHSPASRDQTSASRVRPQHQNVFADGFIRNDAITPGVDKSEHTLLLYNPSDTEVNGTITVMLLDGTRLVTPLTLQSKITGRVDLARVLGMPTIGPVWFSTIVQTDIPIIASVFHRDDLAGGIWISGPTML